MKTKYEYPAAFPHFSVEQGCKFLNEGLLKTFDPNLNETGINNATREILSTEFPIPFDAYFYIFMEGRWDLAEALAKERHPVIVKLVQLCKNKLTEELGEDIDGLCWNDDEEVWYSIIPTLWYTTLEEWGYLG